MKFIRTFALVAGATLLLAACNRDSEETVATVKENTNPLLDFVPMDTAYLAANLEPVPKEITDAYMARFQPALDVISKEVEQFQVDYGSGSYEGNKMAMLASAVLDELGGSISVENLEKLGITPQSHHAIYAMGIFPVVRLSLSDTAKLREAIARIEAKMGFELPENDFNGMPYWRVAENGMPVGVYIAILDGHLAVSVFPTAAEDQLLASFIGEDSPAQSMASTNQLAIMNSKKGYTGYGSGFVDLQKLSNEMMNPDSATHGYLGPDADFPTRELDDVCIAEAKALVAKAPRMTGGVTRFSANEIGIRYELEIEPALAGNLAALVSDTPVAMESDHLLSGSLAIQVGKVRTFVLEKANNIVAAPFQCSSLQDLNQHAADMVTQLNVPMPPMVNNLMGARVRIDEFQTGTEPLQGSGLFALHVDKPEMFVGMATMMVPGFDTLDLANQKEPVEIPSEILQMEGVSVSALMGDNAIGASLGDQTAKDLKQFMAAKPQDNGTFFSVSYDLARQLELQQAMAQNWDHDYDDTHAQVHELAEAIKTSYQSMLGRSRVTMSFTGKGLVIESEMTFK
jgi:hypothetical protein